MRCSIAHAVTTRQQSKLVHTRIAIESIFPERVSVNCSRYGALPPKEIVRPESARIAMQGVQPKGVDEEGLAIAPVEKR